MIKIKSIHIKETGYFTDIICDYLDRKDSVRPFYNQFPDLKGFKHQIEQKRNTFSKEARKELADRLQIQYSDYPVSENTRQNIELLRNENAFTVTTGHQLNIFTGPLYFLYKIITAINLAKTLKENFSGEHFVPVYWMATEDHDFEEISFFKYKGKKLSWKHPAGGTVGDLSTEGLQDVFEEFSKLLGEGTNAATLRKLFQKAYLDQDNLADATRYLANELFGKYGLVIVDGDDAVLKKRFSPFVKDELLNQTSFKAISKTVQSIEKHYKVQQHPREINLFYLGKGFRERIIFEKNTYRVNNTDLVFSEKEILQILSDFPERFSPNVMMRPLYEEVVLPNLCYIGGGGELAYWFELKTYFEKSGIPFPILLLRNSVLLITRKQNEKLQRLGVSCKEIFLKKDDFINKKVRELSEISIDFSEQKKVIKSIFEHLEEISHCTDVSFLGAVKAQQKKQLNGMDHLEKRLLRAQKRKLKDVVDRISVLHHALFPNEGLQERIENFSTFYEDIGEELIDGLIKNLDPLKLEFDVLEI